MNILEDDEATAHIRDTLGRFGVVFGVSDPLRKLFVFLRLFIHRQCHVFNRTHLSENVFHVLDSCLLVQVVHDNLNLVDLMAHESGFEVSEAAVPVAVPRHTAKGPHIVEVVASLHHLEKMVSFLLEPEPNFELVSGGQL